MDRNQLHILQTCFSPSWGGLELQALDVSRRLAGRGNRVWLACQRGSRLDEEAHRAGLGVLPLAVRGYFHPGAIVSIARFLRREEIDIIHCQHSRDIATVVPGKLFSGRSAPLLLSKRVGSYLMKRDPLHRFTYAHVDKVLAISEVIRKNVIATTPIGPERVMTLHDAVDTERFSPDLADRARVRREFGYADSELVVGFMGRFSPGKGHEEFLEAAALLVPEHPRLRFLIVGEASRGEESYETSIRQAAERLKLGNVLQFAGFRQDVPDVLAAFDLFAFPSHAEAFGVVLIEAMAMERPVVSSNCDGVLDIVVDGESGMFIPPKNAPALASAIGRLASEPALRAAMGRAARKRVEALFDERRQTEAILDIYAELLEHGTHGRAR